MEQNLKLVYEDMESPVGKIRMIATAKGLAAIIWEGEDYKRTKLPEALREDDNAILLSVEQQLKEYFAKERTGFDIRFDYTGTDFQKRVWQALLEIPFGKTKTYGELAKMLGDIKAVRAVGGALNKNPISIMIPCHRVIGASGKLVGFAGGLDHKLTLLQLEGNEKTRNLFNQ